MRSGQQTTPLNEKKMSPAKHNCMFGEGGGCWSGDEDRRAMESQNLAI